MHWNERLGPRNRSGVGLAWSGNPTHTNDRNRSLKLRALSPHLDLDALFVSLQGEVRADDAVMLKDRTNIVHFGEELRNFADTAALISDLDLVISVDTSANPSGCCGPSSLIGVGSSIAMIIPGIQARVSFGKKKVAPGKTLLRGSFARFSTLFQSPVTPMRLPL
jgi:hypothetical protein